MSPVYANLVGISVMPIILILLSVIIWTIIKMFSRQMTWNFWKHNIKGTVINMLFLVHPIILKSSM